MVSLLAMMSCYSKLTSRAGNEDNSLIAHMKDLATLNGLNTRVVDEQLDAIIESNVINPVTDWLKFIRRTKLNNPVDELVDLLPVENKAWVKIALYRWHNSVVPRLICRGTRPTKKPLANINSYFQLRLFLDFYL